MRIVIPGFIVLFILYSLWVLGIIHFVDNKSLLYPLLFAPLVEELVFRWAPLSIVLGNKWLSKYKWQIAVMLAFLFAVMHRNHINVFLFQGVFGFIMCYLYIKRKSLLLIILMHASWNAFAIFILKHLI